jgi:hypothetical protein
MLNCSFQLVHSKHAEIFESLMYIHKNYLTASGISFVLTSLREFDHVFMFCLFVFFGVFRFVLQNSFLSRLLFLYLNDKWQRTCFIVKQASAYLYRSTQLGHIPFFLLLYLLVGPSVVVGVTRLLFKI